MLECHVLPLRVHWSQDSNPSTGMWAVGIPSGVFTTVPDIHSLVAFLWCTL